MGPELAGQRDSKGRFRRSTPLRIYFDARRKSPHAPGVVRCAAAGTNQGPRLPPMNFIKCCLIPSGLMLLLGIGLAFFLAKDMPTEWDVAVQVSTTASPEAVHEVIGDFRHWPEWNGFNELFPEPELAFEDLQLGVPMTMHATSDDFDLHFKFTSNVPGTGVTFERTSNGEPYAEESILYEVTTSGTSVTWRTRGTFGDGIVARCFNEAIRTSMEAGLYQNLLAMQRYLERPR